MIRHLIFDLGNVLIHIHPELVMKELMEKCHLTIEDIKSFYLSDLHLGFMEGRFEPEEFYQIMMKKFPTPLSLPEFIRIWEIVIGEPKQGIHRIVSQLVEKYTLSVCSNTDPWHWNKVLREIPLIRKFHHYFLSFEMKLNKPDPQVFNFVLSRLKADGRECVFIDDLEENVRAAEKCGILSIWSSDPGELEQKLKTLKILVDAN